MSQKSVDSVQREIAEEKAGALGRAGRRLLDALETFRAHERHAANEPKTTLRRDRLLWELAERVESFIVQREACGLRDSRYVLGYYDVPREAVARVGARRPDR